LWRVPIESYVDAVWFSISRSSCSTSSSDMQLKREREIKRERVYEGGWDRERERVFPRTYANV
jgi:hypothetical protein